jgi:hypothetical protein
MIKFAIKSVLCQKLTDTQYQNYLFVILLALLRAYEYISDNVLFFPFNNFLLVWVTNNKDLK